MAKKECCCNDCNWCDRNHYRYDWYSDSNNWYNFGELEQCTQPNWNLFGTLTTEIPSVGHCMPAYLCNKESTIWPEFYNCDGDPDFICKRGINLDTYGSFQYLFLGNGNFGWTGSSYFRTPSQTLNNESFGWGRAFYYGEIYPCWFNGLNMTNIENDNEEFIHFTFDLKIEKWNGSNYETILHTGLCGPGKNLRPHPDACSSYNAGGPDYRSWIDGSGCNVFNNEFFVTDDGDSIPIRCDSDFAKMPRGPWPYRFKRNIGPDPNLQFAGGFTCPCKPLDASGEPCNFPRTYTKEQVLAAIADPSIIGSPIYDSGSPDGNIIGYIGPGITYCPLIETSCQNSGPPLGLVPDGDSGPGGNPNNPPPLSERCCTAPYCSNSEICYQLDEEGTPFGWEDVPKGCCSMSNYNSSEENRKFFCWWDPSNRYTTPEWDVKDILTNQQKKLSIHVIVPTKMWNTQNDETVGFCYPNYNEQGRSFGEWSFGMDCEAIFNEIQILESAGFVWSNGREEDGVWINKTPTNALRVLFTMDHADLGQGKVWRALRDWDVKVINLEKTFNENTLQESKFRISVIQKVEEKSFSSLGCDCPSGYVRNPNAGGICGACGYTGSYIRVYPSACDEYTKGCTQYIYANGELFEEPGLTLANSLHCMNDPLGYGSKISFAERGPIVLNIDIEQNNETCIVCNSHYTDTKRCKCNERINTSTKQAGGGRDSIKAILHNGSFEGLYEDLNVVNPSTAITWWNFSNWPKDGLYRQTLSFGYFCNQSFNGGACPVAYEFQKPPAAVYNIFNEHGSRWLTASADLPFPSGNIASPMGGMRYRNAYSGIWVTPPNAGAYEGIIKDILNGANPEQVDFLTPCGLPVYGVTICRWAAPCDPASDTQGNVSNYAITTHPAAVFEETKESFPELAPIGKCVTPCRNCSSSEQRVPCPPPDEDEGPNLCPCCDPELANPLEGCLVPETGPGDCPTQEYVDPNTGQQGTIYEFCEQEECLCNCTKCQKIPEPIPCKEYPCEHKPPTEIGTFVGPNRYSDWGCSNNLLTKRNRGTDFCFECTDGYGNGYAQMTCWDAPSGLNKPKYLGMNSERIYFHTGGNNKARSFYGNFRCAKYNDCCSRKGAPEECYFESFHEGFTCQNYWNYCEAEGQEYSFGTVNFAINWRKHLCNLRKHAGITLSPSFMDGFSFYAQVESDLCKKNATTGVWETNNYDNLSVTGASRHMWNILNSYCYTPGGVFRGMFPYNDSLCAKSNRCENDEIKTDLTVTISKYKIPEIEYAGWKPFDTTYAPNSNRNTLDKNRSHIIISPKGRLY